VAPCSLQDVSSEINEQRGEMTMSLMMRTASPIELA
jgi:hypothetical protein